MAVFRYITERLHPLRLLAAGRPRLQLEFLEGDHFEDGASMVRLQQAVAAAGRHGWVIHADPDEFVELEGLRERL